MFSYIGLCLTAKRSGKSSCVVLPLQEFDRGAMTVLIHGTWSSTDGNVWCVCFKNSKTQGMFTERSYVIVLLLHEFMTFYDIVRWFDFLFKVCTPTKLV